MSLIVLKKSIKKKKVRNPIQTHSPSEKKVTRISRHTHTHGHVQNSCQFQFAVSVKAKKQKKRVRNPIQNIHPLRKKSREFQDTHTHMVTFRILVSFNFQGRVQFLSAKKQKTKFKSNPNTFILSEKKVTRISSRYTYQVFISQSVLEQTKTKQKKVEKTVQKSRSIVRLSKTSSFFFRLVDLIIKSLRFKGKSRKENFKVTSQNKTKK